MWLDNPTRQDGAWESFGITHCSSAAFHCGMPRQFRRLVQRSAAGNVWSVRQHATCRYDSQFLMLAVRDYLADCSRHCRC